jgi:hypothetical protein
MINTRCGLCERADRDYGILMASVSVMPSQLTIEKQRNAWARLSEWVTHVRALPDASAHLAQQAELKNLSGTAYLEDVFEAVRTPKLQKAGLSALSRSDQDQAVAGALVLIVCGLHISPLAAEPELVERIARSWGWKGPRPDWPAGTGQHANL